MKPVPGRVRTGQLRRLSALLASITIMAAGALAVVAVNTPSAAAATTAGCGKAPLASGARTVQSSGKTRSYILRVPDNYDANRAYRLTFAFHMRGSDMQGVDSGGTSGYPWSYYGQRALENTTTIFVAPQGLGGGWGNAGGEDVTFVDDMIGQLDAGLCIDTTQRFALGFSFGGAMSYALACARPTVFRAVAVYGAAQLSGCSGGTQPVGYIGLHGLRDGVLPISNGRALRDTFVRNNGCTPQNPPEPAVGSLTHTVTAYSGCRAGYPVVWAPFDAGHTPGPWDGSAGDLNPHEKSWTIGVVRNFFAQFGSKPPTSTTTTSPSPGQNVMIAGQQSGRCIDVAGAGTANGTQTQLWGCHGNANQRWTYTASQEWRVYGNKCLDVNGGNVVISDCTGAANQKWNRNANGTITSVHSGQCLDANGAGTTNGTRVISWSCNGGANQQWSLRG
ncbi:ricin-type beta-trefoil lectin domain protein [Actinosynnema sp. NPDC023794]